MNLLCVYVVFLECAQSYPLSRRETTIARMEVNACSESSIVSLFLDCDRMPTWYTHLIEVVDEHRAMVFCMLGRSSMSKLVLFVNQYKHLVLLAEIFQER
jgi:hypothetical protein